MKRYDCMKILASKLSDDIIVAANVGNTSRQLHGLRPSEANLYQMNLGSCTAIGLGLALALPHRKVLALDGDGNLLLHLAVLADLANQNPPNLGVIVFDNESYESGGGLPTATAGRADLTHIARACGIRNSRSVNEIGQFEEAINLILKGSELA
ncbi:MAG: thiamine pyrophosphate-dependent enzyme, partial [Dehalococcoidia bacterium]